MHKIIFSIVALLVITGCANNQQTYYWGNYEQLVYNSFKNPEQADPATQLEKLQKDISIAATKGKPVPPGVYAHMGMLYASLGKAEEAKASLKQEASLYPESSQFMNVLLNNMEKGQ